MKHICLIISFLASLSLFSQQRDKFYNELELLRSKRIDSVESFGLSSIEKYFIQWELQYLKSGIIDSVLHNSMKQYETMSIRDSIIQKIHLGKFELVHNEYGISYNYLKEALTQSQSINDSVLSSLIISDIIVLTTRVEKLRELNPKYIRDYIKLAPNAIEQSHANYFHFYEKSAKTEKADIDSLQYEVNIAREANCTYCEIKVYQRTSGVLNFLENKKDSAITYNFKALKLIDNEKPYDYILQIKKGILNNLGRIYSDNGNQTLALEYLNKAYNINSNKDRLINDQIILANISIAHRELGNFEKALDYYQKSIEKSDTFAEIKHATEIKKLEKLYKNSELKSEKLVIEKENLNRKNLNIILGSVLGGTIIFSIMGYFMFKRRQYFLQQEKDLILKEHELHSIDVMIEGQEKERQRIANELHDDLGGLLATLKLYVQNLKVRKSILDKEHDVIINKTDTLLEETYQKVRSIAHTQNAGVLTSEGLIPTIKNYASKVSISNSLIVEVIDFGMEQRLNNSTEITIFRIIQELITNIIKHANASQITVSITNHQNSINLLVEDNGKGFDVDKIDMKKGLGLSNIKKRVENLKGTLDIDSYSNKGTSVIIDIPNL